MIKDLRGLGKVEASDTTIKKRVERNNVRSCVWIGFHLNKHQLVNFKSFFKLVRLLKSFDHCCVDYCVHLGLIFFHILKNLNSSQYIIVFDTCLQKTAVSHTAWNQLGEFHLPEHHESLIKLISLAISFDQNSKSDSTSADMRRI